VRQKDLSRIISFLQQVEMEREASQSHEELAAQVKRQQDEEEDRKAQEEEEARIAQINDEYDRKAKEREEKSLRAMDGINAFKGTIQEKRQVS
jgi:hypothetical protein